MVTTVSFDDLRIVANTQRSDAELTPFRDIGIAYTDALLTNTTLTDAMKNNVALYVSSHFFVVSVERGGIQSMHVGQSEDVYVNTIDRSKVGLMSTRFGQMACMIDITGTLSREALVKTGEFTFKSYRAYVE